MATYTNMTDRRTPITELSDPESKEREFSIMLGEAREAAEKRLQVSKRNRSFYSGEHYQKGAGFGFLWTKANEHIPKLSGEETHDMINNLLPILVKSKPGIKVIAEDPSMPIDTRGYDEFGMLMGGFSDVPPEITAEAFTELLDVVYKRQSGHILDSLIVQESLLSGIAFTTHVFNRGRHGMDVRRKLLEPDQFLGDPDGYQFWDFSDYKYIILCEMRTPWEIRQDYGIEEDEYAGGKSGSNEPTRTGILRMLRSSKSTSDGIQDKYPVHKLYYRPYIGTIDEDTKANAPPIQQMTFINECYFVRNSQRDISYWHQDFPVTAFQTAPQPFREAGTAEVSVMIATQMAINIARDSAIATTMFNANPGYEVEEGSVGKGQLNNNPGGVNTWGSGSVAGGRFRERPGRDTGSQFNLLSFMKQQARDRGGDSGGLLQGGQPGNIRGHKHYNSALNQVLTRNGYRVKVLDTSWEREARMTVSNLQQFVEFDRDYHSKIKHFEEHAYLNDAMRNLRYDIDINSKENMPYSIEEKLNFFLTLYDRGLVSVAEFYAETGIKLSPETMQIIEQSAASWVPGIPQGESAAMEAQAGQDVNQLTGLMGQ